MQTTAAPAVAVRMSFRMFVWLAALVYFTFRLIERRIRLFIRWNDARKQATRI